MAAILSGGRRRWHFVFLGLPREWPRDFARRVDLVARAAGMIAGPVAWKRQDVTAPMAGPLLRTPQNSATGPAPHPQAWASGARSTSAISPPPPTSTVRCSTPCGGREREVVTHVVIATCEPRREAMRQPRVRGALLGVLRAFGDGMRFVAAGRVYNFPPR